MLSSILRCVVLYFMVILAVRIMGKRQLGELQPSELVITIMISELAALPLEDINMPLIRGVLLMFIMVTLELLVSYATLKSMRLRAFFYGRPILLIYHGKINQQALLKTRVSMEDIMEAVRGSGILKVEDVETAVLETNGTLSVIPRAESAPPSATDLKVRVPKSGGIPDILIMNGKLIEETISKKALDHQQVEHILNGYGVRLRDVFMLTMDDAGKTFMVKREQV